MSDLFGYEPPQVPFKDIRNTRESVAEEKARLCMRLNELCRTPPPLARDRLDKSSSRVARHAQERVQGARQQRQFARRSSVGNRAT